MLGRISLKPFRGLVRDALMEMEDVSEQAREVILSAVANQLRDNDPPMVRETLERLLGAGHTEEEARELIAIALATEIYHADRGGYDEARYGALLEALPELPVEDDEEQAS